MNERLEKNIEKYFCEQVKKIGGMTIKMGKDGNPDRLALFPRGIAYLVELKSLTGICTPLQKQVHRKLDAEIGWVVEVLNSKRSIDAFIKRVDYIVNQKLFG